jgi:phosphoribosylcarboxyaminoimidazole (NCAIR) mutase
MRKIIIIAGSKNDLKQCQMGFNWLLGQKETINVKKVHVASQHRHTLKVQQILIDEVDGLTGTDPIDAIIACAGWAAHLPGCCDAFLRYRLKNTTIPVIGVAIQDGENHLHNQAAILSITQVPGTQVIFKNGDEEFFGEKGFLAACKFAATGTFPVITLKKPPESFEMSLDEALAEAKKL